MATGTRVGVNSHDGRCLLSTQRVPTAMQGRCYTHFTDEETEVQGGQVNHPNSQWHNQHGTQV